MVYNIALIVLILADAAVFYYVPRSVRRGAFKLYLPGRGVILYKKWTS